MPDNNENQNNTHEASRDEMIFLPESPDTPSFGPPASPGSGQRPPVTVIPIPIIPRPEQNNRQGYCYIRFLHAAVGYEAVNVAIGSRPVAHNLQYGEASSYYIETDGFVDILVSDPRARRLSITRDTFLFADGDVYTVAFVNGMDGLTMTLIPDMPCRNQRRSFSCVRAVNLSYNAPALDVAVQNGRARFQDLRFKAVPSYRQVRAGTAEFYVSEMNTGAMAFDVTYQLDAGGMYTLYIIGDAYGYPTLSPVFLEDYSGLEEYL